MLILVWLPLEKVGIFDETLTVRELWAYGYAPFVVLIGVILLAASIGLLRGRSWSRWIIVFLYPLTIPFAVIYSLRHPESIGTLALQGVVAGSVHAAFCYWYLFCRERVKRLFT